MERSKCQQLEEVEGFRFNGLITQQQPFNHQNPTLLFPKLPIDNDSSLISLDIGDNNLLYLLYWLLFLSSGTLVKVVYLVRENKKCVTSCSDGESSDVKPTGFHKNMTIKVDENWNVGVYCSINQKTRQLFKVSKLYGEGATGGGAYKYADIFRDRLDITFDIVDEIASTVAGANFLLQEIDREAFTHISGKKTYVNIDHCSGVSIIKVTGNKKFERVTGTHFGGGTIFGFASLLTNCQSYDELLEISQHGDNRALDLTVGDIYGDTVLLPLHILKLSPHILMRQIINFHFPYKFQISYLVAAPLGIKRICFGGQVAAVFLQHEGFLGAVGALLNYKKIDLNILAPHKLTAYDSSRLSDVGEEFHGKLEERVEDRLNREVERLKAELDRLQNDKATLVKNRN
ncbi:pantothenate kinase 2 [Quercus suber]|uniref:Pantothenate kinase 2 n=1 Tax=Quercus suber TaxID=58331 RepID=A0AAW0M2W6_QUESU